MLLGDSHGDRRHCLIELHLSWLELYQRTRAPVLIRSRGIECLKSICVQQPLPRVVLGEVAGLRSPSSQFVVLSTCGVIVSPHSTDVVPDLNELQANLFCENLKRYLAGEPLVNELDKKLGY